MELVLDLLLELEEGLHLWELKELEPQGLEYDLELGQEAGLELRQENSELGQQEELPRYLQLPPALLYHHPRSFHHLNHTGLVWEACRTETHVCTVWAVILTLRPDWALLYYLTFCLGQHSMVRVDCKKTPCPHSIHKFSFTSFDFNWPQPSLGFIFEVKALKDFFK